MVSDPIFPEYPTLVEDFRVVARISGVDLPIDTLHVELLPAPHKPPSALPIGKMAAYVFSWKGTCLKVGKVGPNSQPRYTHQHYSAGSSGSNLAKSIIEAKTELGLNEISDANVGRWIREHVDRCNFILDQSCGIAVLTLLEAFLQCRLNPRFEGFKSQRSR